MSLWANLFEGAASAIIGGVVAALTAWTVVILTRRHERRLENEKIARDAALKLTRSLVRLVAEIREYEHAHTLFRSRKRYLDALVAGHIRLADDLYTAVPLITVLDANLAEEVRRLGGLIGMLLPDHSRHCSSQNLAHALELAVDLQKLVGAWLASGDRPVPER